MKVKVKKTRGVTGNQHNYALVSGSIWNYEDKPTTNSVGTTLSPVPREEANIEAEKNETIVYPDKDGMLAHSKIGGKRHSEGGTPLNVPDGSFVFSDFRGMNIKNKELLKNVFNMSTNKAVTPADVAKRYEINYYKQVVQDPWADPMDKKTAQLMIENNMRKLGQLALIQEARKGFPDGIPDIAKPLFGSDIAQGEQLPQEEQQEQPQEQAQEPPQAQKGLNKSSYTPNEVDSILYANKNKNFVNRYINPSIFPIIQNPDGGYSSELMESSDNFAYPTIIQDPKTGTLTNFNNIPYRQKAAYDYAMKNNEAIRFPNEQLAEWFANNGYKSGIKTYTKHKQGGGLPKHQTDGPVKTTSPGAQNYYIQKAMSEGRGNEMMPNPLTNSGTIYQTEEPGWFDNTVTAVTHPFATLMSTGDRSGNSWQSYVKEHGDNPIDMALNGVAAAYAFSPQRFAQTPGLLQTASQLKNANNLRNAAFIYDMQNPVLRNRKLGGPLDYAQAGKQVVTPPIEDHWYNHPWESFKTAYNAAPGLVMGASTLGARYATKGTLWAARKMSPTLNSWLETLSKLPIKERLVQFSKGAGKFLIKNPIGQALTVGTLFQIGHEIFGDDPKAAEQANKTIEQQYQQMQKDTANQSQYSNEGQNPFAVDPTKRTPGLLDGTTTVTPVDTTTVVKKAPPVKKPAPSITIPPAGQTWNTGDASGDWGQQQKLGGSLGKFQTKGQFDIRDQQLQDAAKAAGAYLTRPSYFPYWENVGNQSPTKNSGNFTRTPEGVIVPKVGWTNPNTKTSYKGIQDFVDYADPYVNFEDYDTQTNDKQKGIDLWKKNIAGTAAEREKAGRWLVDRTNTYNKSVLGDKAPLTVDPNVKGFWEPGSEFMNIQFAQKLPPTAPPVVNPPVSNPPTKTEPGTPARAQYEEGIAKAPWWNYDVVNYNNQLGNYFDIEPGMLPPYRQYNPYVADPTFLDPARAIAQQQGVQRQAGEAIMSGSDPSVGRANVIAAAANSANPVANIMAQYDQNNVGIANQFGQQAAQTMNQGQLQNLNFQKEYADEIATRRQQYLNALREGKTDVAQSIMQGMKNAAETSWMNATSDSYSVDPSTGSIYFKRGFDPNTGSYRGKQQNDADLLRMYMSDPYNLSKEDAIDLITGRRRKKDDNTAKMGGMLHNPMDVIWNY